MPPLKKEGDYIVYAGSNFIKQRLLLSLLSGKPVRIIDIRSDDVEPGLREYEVSLIRILDKISNGTRIEINPAGTVLSFRPGLLHGGRWQHDCSLERGIGYYLDVLIALGPFCKLPLDVVLRGITNSKESPSVDYIKSAAFNVLKRFLLDDEDLQLKVVRRGLAPLGGGEIHFQCPVRKILRTLQFLNQGMVKRIRGIVYACKVSPAMANRTVETAKGVMLKFLPDVYIYTDQNRGKLSGKSPGFGICLQAETTEGVYYAAELNSHAKGDGQSPSVPEDLGRQVAMQLLDEIHRGGCCDSTYQWLVTLFMTLGPKNVSKYLTGESVLVIRFAKCSNINKYFYFLGPLSTYTVNFLQHLRDFFSITFKLENPDDDDEDDQLPGSQKVLMTCVGIGYSNLSKRVL